MVPRVESSLQAAYHAGASSPNGSAFGRTAISSSVSRRSTKSASGRSRGSFAGSSVAPSMISTSGEVSSLHRSSTTTVTTKTMTKRTAHADPPATLQTRLALDAEGVLE